MEFRYKGQRFRATGGGDTVPIGTLHHFLGTTAPEDYLACDGQELQIADYPALANFFETQFGSVNQFGGDGETTFCVPDLRGKFLLGSSETHELLESGGEETHKLTINEMPSHIHNYVRKVNYDGVYYTPVTSGNAALNSNSTNTGATGNDQPHNNMPPYFSVLICIKAK